LLTLPAALDGLTIGQLSDLHRGPYVSEEHIRRAAEIATSLQPDVIVLTGDFVSVSAQYAASCIDALVELRSRQGVFAVLGNHDYWTGQVEIVRQTVERRGVEVLMNRSVRLRRGGTDWWLCGVDDVWSGRPDLGAALLKVPQEDFRVLLCHEPDFADTASRAGIPLQLSGHSHGGQVVVPGIGPIVLPPYGEKYPIGLQRVQGSRTLVYTNVGVGLIAWELGPMALAVRWNCPPEVTLLTLRRAQA
jgi:predicted MPP superfamily phosphohydrolase